jgi:hypothetical protein
VILLFGQRRVRRTPGLAQHHLGSATAPAPRGGTPSRNASSPDHGLRRARSSCSSR